MKKCLAKQLYFRFIIGGFMTLLICGYGCSDSTLVDKGDKLPNYKGLSLSGDSISLYDYFGKDQFLIVNFWAGWCPDCRAHNPELVALYQKYKDLEVEGRTFDIISISFDKTDLQWRTAVERDKLDWGNHITDLGSFASAQAKPFGVKWIPTNYLVDENGIVLATNVDRKNFERIVRRHYN